MQWQWTAFASCTALAAIARILRIAGVTIPTDVPLQIELGDGAECPVNPQDANSCNFDPAQLLRQNKALREKLREQAADTQAEGECWSFRPIGVCRSCFQGLCGTPRQGQLVASAEAVIELASGVSPTALVGLEEYSHVWIQWIFHRNNNIERTTNGNWRGVSAKVHPPWHPNPTHETHTCCCVPEVKVGVFGCRTPHRYNPIGISVGRVAKVDLKKKCIFVTGLDLVDGTPILDIKPYLPHFDAYPDASCAGWVGAADQISLLPVEWSSEASQQLQDESKPAVQLRSPFRDVVKFGAAISETLALDIRSRFLKSRHDDKEIFKGTLRFCGYIVDYELQQGKDNLKRVKVCSLRAATVQCQ